MVSLIHSLSWLKIIGAVFESEIVSHIEMYSLGYESCNLLSSFGWIIDIKVMVSIHVIEFAPTFGNRFTEKFIETQVFDNLLT